MRRATPSLQSWALTHSDSLHAVIPVSTVVPLISAGCTLIVLACVGIVGAWRSRSMGGRCALLAYGLLLGAICLAEIAGASLVIYSTQSLADADATNSTQALSGVNAWLNATYFECCPALAFDADACWVPDGASVIGDANCASLAAFQCAARAATTPQTRRRRVAPRPPRRARRHHLCARRAAACHARRHLLRLPCVGARAEAAGHGRELEREQDQERNFALGTLGSYFEVSDRRSTSAKSALLPRA